MAGMKKIKKATIGLFWKEKEAAPADLGPATFSPDPLTAPVAPVYTSTKTNTVDQEFYNALEGELQKNMPLEFAEFYNQMSVINEKFANLDEPTRYQLAFHAAQTALKARNLNLTYASLSRATAKLLDTLANEKQEFSNQNEQGFNSNLSAIKRKVEEISNGIKSRENQLLSLQQELDAFIAAKNQEKKKLESDRDRFVSERVVTESQINQLEQKKNDRQSRFEGAWQAQQERFEQLRRELESYIKGIK
jgi:hypothetical protein